MFVFILLLVVGGSINDAWLVLTNQVGSFDGLFLFCSSSVIAIALGCTYAGSFGPQYPKQMGN